MTVGGIAAAPDALAAGEATSSRRDTIEEIVVTAQKRAESSDKVPITIDAFAGDDLANAGLTNTFDLQFVTPGLSIAPNQSDGQIFIRGVGTNLSGVGNDPSSAAYIDGVYQARTPLLLTRMYDIDRIEVLKGPQGTLYGRNSTGGAINVITRAPQDDFGGYVNFSAGSDGLFGADAAINAPFSGGAFRLAASYAVSDGYVDNVLSKDDLEAVDFKAVRGKLRLGDLQGWHATLGLEVVRDDGSRAFGLGGIPSYGGPYFTDFGPVHQNSPYKVGVSPRMGATRSADSATLQVDGPIGNVGFRSITAYSDLDLNEFVDTDGVSADLENLPDINHAKQFSQEFQLFSTDEGPFTWIAGAYYLRAEQKENWTFMFVPVDFSISDIRTADTDAYAAFAEGSYAFTPRAKLTLGARYSSESKDATGGGNEGSRNFSDFSPKIAFEYTPSDSTLLYASVQKGFKSGGFNTSFGAAPFDPEEIIAYEVGAKMTSSDRRFRLSTAAFYYDYKDLQALTAIWDSSTTFQSLVQNAASAEIYGLDFSAEALLGMGFSVDLNAEALHSEYKDFVFVDDPFTPENNINLKGNTLPQAPKTSGTIGLQWKTSVGDAGDFTTRVEYTYQSSIFFGVENSKIESRDSVGLWNARAGYDSADDNWSANVALRNFTDETYPVNVLDFSSCCNVLGVYGAPRTVEASVEYRF